MILGLFWLFHSYGGRVVMERALNRRGCLIGTAHDGRFAKVADGNLVLIDTNRVETTVAKLNADIAPGPSIHLVA